MAVQTVEQVQRLAPYLEGLEKRLLQSAFGTFDDDGTQTQKGLLDRAITLPQQQVAGLDPLQQQAFAAAPQMFGSFAPFLQRRWANCWRWHCRSCRWSWHACRSNTLCWHVHVTVSDRSYRPCDG